MAMCMADRLRAERQDDNSVFLDYPLGLLKHISEVMSVVKILYTAGQAYLKIESVCKPLWASVALSAHR